MDQMLKTLMHLLLLISLYVRLVILVPVVQTLDSAIKWIMQLVSLILIRTLGARDFSSAVSGFWLRPTAEDVSAFGQHRKFPLHARKTSDTQGNLSVG